MRAQGAGPRVAPGVAADSRGDGRTLTQCCGCGASDAVCPACGVCRHCRNTDRQHGTTVAAPCILCDRGKPAVELLPWHTRGMQPLTLRAPQ